MCINEPKIVGLKRDWDQIQNKYFLPGVHLTLTTEHGVMGKSKRSTSFQTPRPPGQMSSYYWGPHYLGLGTRNTNFENEQPVMPRWKRGSVQEVAWLSGGKHAGGYSYRCFFKLLVQVPFKVTRTGAFSSYSYRRFSFPHLCATFNSHLSQDLCLYSRMLRLCPLGKSGKRGLTEKCFQRLPLRFLTNKTWIRTLHRSGKVSRFLKLKQKKS